MQVILAVAFWVIAAHCATLTVNDAIVNEGTNSVQFTAVLQNSAATALSADQRTFKWSTEAGSAKANVDYTEVTDAQFSVSNQDGSNAKFSVNIIDDNVQELIETFKVTYEANDPGAVDVLDGFAVASILDAEGATLNLQDDSRVEGVDDHFSFSVVLSHDIDFDLPYFGFSTTSSTNPSNLAAKSGLDYADTQIDDITQFFPKGSTAGSTKQFNVTILNDNVQEDIETFEVAITYSGSVVGFASGGNVAIGTFLTENEGVTLCIEDKVFAEGEAATMDFVVSLSHAVDTDIVFPVSTVSGSNDGLEIAAIDEFVSKTETVTFSKGSFGDKTFSVDVPNDNVQSPHHSSVPAIDFGRVNFGVEYAVPDKVWDLSIGEAANAFKVNHCGANPSTKKTHASGFIYDDEGVTLSITRQSGSDAAQAEDTHSFGFEVQLSHAVASADSRSKSTAVGASFMYTEFNSNASLDNSIANVGTGRTACDKLPSFGSVDMPVNGPIDVCFPYGVYPGSTVFPIINKEEIVLSRGPVDIIDEGDETFTIGIALAGDSAGYGITISNGNITSTILENTNQSVTVTHDTLTVAEGSSSKIVFSVSMNQPRSSEISVSWETADGTTENDFNQVQSGILTWPAFSVAGSTKLAEVLIVDDNVQETNETFTVIFKTLEINGADESFVVTITDDEDATIAVSDMASPQDESSIDWSLDVALSHAFSEDISIPWYGGENVLSNFPADVNVYSSNSGTVTLPAGSKVATINIEVPNDNIQTFSPVDVQSFLVNLNVSDTNLKINSAESSLSGEVKITDNEEVTVSIASESTTETSGIIEFEITLSHKVNSDVIVTFSSTEGSALGTEDFKEVTSKTATILAGNLTTLGTVTIVDDNIQEKAETFSVSLQSVLSPAGISIASGTSKTAVLYITDFENITFSVEAPTVPLVEEATNNEYEFKVSMDKTSIHDVNVKYQFYPNSAFFGIDFDNTANPGVRSGTVTIPKGANEAIVKVTVLNDDIAELDERFSLGITSIENLNGINLDGVSAFATIGDTNMFDEDVMVVVTSPTQPIVRDTSAVFDIVLTHEISKTVVIEYTTGSDSAIESIDYTKISGQTRFQPGQGKITKQINVPTLLPLCQEKQENKSFTFTVDKPTKFNNTHNQGSATILPFDVSPTITLLPNFNDFEEGDDVSFSVSLSHCIAADISVEYNITAGRDYVNVPISTLVTIDAEVVAGSILKSFTVPTKNDNIQSLAKSFSINIHAPASNNVLDDYNINIIESSQDVSLADDEGATLSITQCIAQNVVNDAFFSFEVTLSHQVEADLTGLSFATVDDTAKAGVDFAATSGTFDITSGLVGNVQTIGVTAFDRSDIVRPNGTDGGAPVRFMVELTPSSAFNDLVSQYKLTWVGDGTGNDLMGKASLLGNSDTLVSMDQVTATEGDVATFTLTVAEELNQDVILSWEVTNGTASLTDDFEGATSGTIELLANVGKGQQVSFNISIADDWVQELDENFDVQFAVVSPAEYADAIVFDGVNQNHQIMDNDQTTIFVQDVSVDEGASTMDFSVSLSHYTYADVSFSLDLVFASPCGSFDACEGIDINGESGGYDVYFTAESSPPSNQVGGQVKTISISLLNDDIQEPTETFKVKVRDGSINTTLPSIATGSKLEGVASITDDEGFEIMYTIPEVLETAGENSIEFTLTYSHELSTLTQVNFETMDGTAMSSGASATYTQKNGTIQIASGTGATNTIFMSTVNNDVVNKDGEFTVQLTFSPAISEGPASLIGRIINDDENASISPVTTFSIDEYRSSIDFKVTLSHAVDAPFNVTYATVGSGYCEAGTDFEDKSGTLEFAGFVNEEKTVTVSIINDDVVEADEVLELDLTLVDQGYLSRINLDIVKSTIKDDDEATLSLSGDFNANENTDMVFTVFLSHKVGADLSVEYSTFAGSAEESTDFVPQISQTSLNAETDPNINSGNSFIKIQVGLVDDNIIEKTETFAVELSQENSLSLSNVKIDPNNVRATGRINDNEEATISIEETKSVKEDVGSVSFTVSMSHAAQDDVVVKYYNTNGLASSSVHTTNIKRNIDFQQIGSFDDPESLTINAGSKEASIAMEIYDDAVLEIEKEDFCVVLQSVDEYTANAVSVSENTGTVILIDDNEGATIYVQDTIVDGEGNAMTFNVHLSHAVQQYDIKVDYETVAGSASTSDFEYTTGTLSFDYSVETLSTATFSVPITTDNYVEANETFAIELTNVQAILPAAYNPDAELDPIKFLPTPVAGVGTILGTQGSITIADTTAKEDDEFCVFTVTLSGTASADVDIDFATHGGEGDNFPQPGQNKAFKDRDYIANDGTITLSKEETTTTIKVPIVDNDIVQGPHAFSVSIEIGNAVFTRVEVQGGHASCVIEDNDSAKITISDAMINEDDVGVDAITFVASLDNPVLGSVAFFYSSSDNSATSAGENDKKDFTSQTNTAVTFEAEDADSVCKKSVNIVIPLFNDNVVEGDESFDIEAATNIILGNFVLSDSNLVSWDRNSATGIIKDNEGATARIENTVFPEGDGTQNFEVRLSHQIRVAATVQFSVTDGTAKRNVDYIYSSGTFAFDTCDDCLPGPTALIPITVIDDQMTEFDETFTVSVASTSGPFEMTSSSAEVKITDDDAATVYISDKMWSENEGTVMAFSVTLSHEVDDRVLTVDWETRNIAGEGPAPHPGKAYGKNVNRIEITPMRSFIQPDYQLASGEGLVLSKGDNFINVTIYDDTEQECDEDFEVYIKNLVGVNGLDISLGKAVATGTIGNDDEGLVIKASSKSQSEKFLIMQTIISMSHAVDRDMFIEYNLAPDENAISRLAACNEVSIDNAEGCKDNTKGVMNVLAHKANFYSFNTLADNDMEVNIDIRNDQVAQPDGTFRIDYKLQTLCEDSSSLTFTPGNEVFTIEDDEKATLEIVDLTADENDVFNVAIRLSHAIERDFTVDFSVDDTGIESDVITQGGSVTFSASQSANQERIASITVEKDLIPEDDEVFYLNIKESDVPSFAVIGSSKLIGTVTIRNDDRKGPVASVESIEMEENGNFAVFEVKIETGSESDQQATEGGSISFTTEDSSAKSGIDFVAQSGTVTWTQAELNGQVTKQIRINVINRAGCNMDREFRLVLNKDSGDVGFKFNVPSISTTAMIKDDDTTEVTLSASNAVPGSPIFFTAKLSGVCPFDVQVPLEVTAGTAIVGTHFVQPTIVTCRIPAGESSCSISTTTKEVVVGSSGLTVKASINKVQFESLNSNWNSNSVTQDSEQFAIAGTIADLPTIGFASDAGSVSEGDSTSMTINLSDKVESSTTVSVQISAGKNFPSSVQSTIIPAGQTSSSVSISIPQDDIHRFDYSVEAVLSVTSEEVAIGQSTFQLTIKDETPLEIVSSASSVKEGETATVSFELKYKTEETVSISVETQDGTATSPTNYVETQADYTTDVDNTMKAFNVETKEVSGEQATLTFQVIFISDGKNLGTSTITISDGTNSVPAVTAFNCNNNLRPTEDDSRSKVELLTYVNDFEVKASLKGCFIDADVGDKLTYTASVMSEQAIQEGLSATVSSDELTIRAIVDANTNPLLTFAGEYEVSVTATDDSGTSATMIVEVSAKSTVSSLSNYIKTKTINVPLGTSVSHRINVPNTQVTDCVTDPSSTDCCELQSGEENFIVNQCRKESKEPSSGIIEPYVQTLTSVAPGESRFCVTLPTDGGEYPDNLCQTLITRVPLAVNAPSIISASASQDSFVTVKAVNLAPGRTPEAHAYRLTKPSGFIPHSSITMREEEGSVEFDINLGTNAGDTDFRVWVVDGENSAHVNVKVQAVDANC